MKKNIVIIILLIIGGINSFAQNDAKSIDLLKSNDLLKRIEVLKLLKQRRTQSVEEMISVLNGNFSPDIKDSAAIALGDCRASEAVDALINNIKLDVRPRVIMSLSEEEICPISTSLEKIGNPSVPAIIKFLKQNNSVLGYGESLEEREHIQIRTLLLRTLCRIEGDKDIVQLRLQKTLAAENDPQKRDLLQLALETLDKMSFVN